MFAIADRTISTTGVLTTVYQVHDENDNKIDKSYENIYFWFRDTILSTGWTDFRQHQKKNFFFYPKTLGYKQYILTSITYLLPIKRGCSHTVTLSFNKTFNIDSTRWYCIHSMSDSIKHETFFYSSQHIHHPGKRGSPQTKKTQVGFQLDCESESKEESKSIQKGK